MSQPKVEIGIVVPIYQKQFICKLVQQIMELGSTSSFVICIVNDGNPDVEHLLAEHTWPENVITLNLPENRRFAGANNSGWKHLTDKFPSVKYLGTINDDTVPHAGWLDALVDALEKYPQTALAAPSMETDQGWLGTRRNYATWQLRNADIPVVCSCNQIKADTFVPVVSGFCFLARRDALEDVGYLDERYRNSCEDVDLCLKLISKNWRIVVCKDSRVFHYGGTSRYLKGANTDIGKSHALLAEKWGYDLTRFNAVRAKTIAHCCAFNQEHFIEAWVRNAATYADELIVLYSKVPWEYNRRAKYIIKPDGTGEILNRLKVDFPKLIVVEGKWPDQTRQRNEALRIAKRRGGGYLLIVDVDEFFESEKALAALDWMVKRPSQVWFMHHIQLIKQIDWGVVTREGDPCFQFAIDLDAVRVFQNKRRPKAKTKETIPEDVCKCFHFSYLMPKEKLREKLASFGATNEIRANWLTEVWPNIKPGIQNFHPVDPSGWKRIRKVSVPEKIINLIPWLRDQ